MTWHRKIPGQAACGPCCGIKEKLQTLWDRTINSILRINQVEPDDQGNIRITSDSEALTVTEGTNEIILGLDTSELPAAVVQSVNGQTGAVILDAGDISTVGGDVQSDIQDLANDISGNTAAISAEALARQNADTALQNNINALQASIPQEAADAVAADPTVQSFAAAAADIPNKVDKRSGSGLRAYTHTGSTQDDTPVIDGTTGTTIPIRDSNGRLQAADPAAGATDKTLVTANWVSQTGAGAPNNLTHKTGNETFNGIKAINQLKFVGSMSSQTANTDYLLLKHSLASTTQNYRVIFLLCKTNPTICQLIYLNYEISADRAVSITDSRVTTLSDYGYINKSTYTIYVENNQAHIAIRTTQGQAITAQALVNWVGGRFGVTSDITDQGTIVTIPSQYSEVEL